MEADSRPHDAESGPPDPRGASEAEAQLAALLSSANDAIVAIDASGRIRSFNAGAERLFGHRAGDAIGENVRILMPHGPEREQHGRQLARYLRTGEARIIGIGRDVEGLRADGTLFPLRLTVGEVRVGEVRQFVGIMHDLSDLQRAERLNRAIVETAADGILVLDADGRITEVNPAAARQFALPAGEFAGRHLHDLLASGADRAALPFPPAAGEGPGPGPRMAARRADGTTFPMRLSFGATAGPPAAYTVMVRDESGAVAAEEQLRRAADEREALRRLTMRVAVEAPVDEVCAAAAEVMAALLGSTLGLVARFDGDTAELVGLWPEPERGMERRRPLSGEGALARVFRTGRQAAVADYAALAAVGDPAGRMGLIDGCGSGLAHPVRVAGRLWGAVLVAAPAGGTLAADAPDRLARVGELIALAVSNAEARARLASQAEHDPLTGLANHRVFHDRLRLEVARSRTHGRPLSLVLLDVDNFKTVNDKLGHQAGDALIADLGDLMGGLARPGDLIARIGGDEFGWILPEADGEAAARQAERARTLVRGRRASGQAVTISAGVCELVRAENAVDLFRLADGALYWAKDHGRDGVCLYEPEVVRELSHAERADHLARHQALLGIRALARAVDAKDPLTRRHSERVADCADRLAAARGWDDERRAKLREAALLHGVGKIGIPDAVLFKPGRLNDEEFDLIRAHPDLGAEIADEVLHPEQVRWIREHHERIDGRGYPLGLTGERISEGGRILALSDAWDVMTSLRAYKDALALEDGLTEVRRCAGSQFDPELAALLVELHQEHPRSSASA